MKTFNKYQFIEELNKFIIEEIKNGNCQSSDDYYTLMHEEIDRACIYTADCFDICKELSATHFNDYDMECNTITDLAYAALYEYAVNEMDVHQFDELLEALNA
jgi:uridine phosphorylase